MGFALFFLIGISAMLARALAATGTERSRSPRRFATSTVEPTAAMPLGLASSVDHCSSGAVMPATDVSRPSTTGQP